MVHSHGKTSSLVAATITRHLAVLKCLSCVLLLLGDTNRNVLHGDFWMLRCYCSCDSYCLSTRGTLLPVVFSKMESHGVTWPPPSPDLNPVQMVKVSASGNLIIAVLVYFYNGHADFSESYATTTYILWPVKMLIG